MDRPTIIDDLYRYNSWSNARLFSLCEGLTDAQLDQPREIGFGTLRNTLFHMLVSEEIWLERWTSVPWRTFPTAAEGLSLNEIARRMERVAIARQQLIDDERSTGWQRMSEYQDSKGNPHRNHLRDLLLHVANHGIHHRAQALHFLKHCNRTMPGGLDYIFYRLANPHVKQEAATADSMRKYGLEVATGSSGAVAWDAPLVRDYFAYGDWANQRLAPLLSALSDTALDRSWNMGIDSLRMTALHLADAERWWLQNWTVGPTAFEKAPSSTSMAELLDRWERIREDRARFLATLDESSAQRVVTVLIGPMSVRMPVIESLVQLCGHGTHHRAQLINMLRRSGATPPGCDYIVYLREG